MKSLNALYLGHFIGLYLQRATMRDEGTSLSGQKSGILLFTIKVANLASFPLTEPTVCTVIHHRHCATLVELVGHGEAV